MLLQCVDLFTIDFKHYLMHIVTKTYLGLGLYRGSIDIIMPLCLFLFV